MELVHIWGCEQEYDYGTAESKSHLGEYAIKLGNNRFARTGGIGYI